ncbi:hypothetical protein NCLIV_062300 [Neospora caninum Liverpool]|uniref:Uncharacterized protein n=1 Tax=Neospora caninum (strain Liverpool) TaxID=572307 RepID=F0VQ07_NEOCL|nr:hypothetical protein NCLIV_062300 [Neospora caninum Liverpool]CBZ55804.1 hypothetical protein NCLIV_062300 [Neospora caninum Liverpool]|eukprot:XP_003885830.1 hypothetical protein NCLIV_062300 [Neospora caninum Liverpool]
MAHVCGVLPIFYVPLLLLLEIRGNLDYVSRVLGALASEGDFHAPSPKIDRIVNQMETYIRENPEISDVWRHILRGKNGIPEVIPGVKHTVTSFYRSAATKLNISNTSENEG